MKRFAVLFAGGRQAGCIGLLALKALGCEVLGVVAYDQPVADLAAQLGLTSFGSIHDAGIREGLSRAELLVSVHGREMIPEALLRLPRHGGINMHPCLYAYKGANPIERLLKDGNTRASVGVHRMNGKVDAGDVLVEEFADISGRQTVEEVYNRLYPLYATALMKAIRQIRESP